MPLILLLQQTFGKFSRDVSCVGELDLFCGVNCLTEWNKLIALEETLLLRARGVFMTRWFGPNVPMHGGDVRIAIANLDALTARYLELRRQLLSEHRGLSLTGPVAGMAGTLTGAFVAPGLPSMLFAAIIAEVFPNWVTNLVGALNTITFGFLLPALLLLGLPIATIGYLPLTFGFNALSIYFDFIGAATELLVAVLVFFEQLIGPREGVRNPLIRQLLGLFDRIVTIVPFLYLFAFLIVVYVGARLSPLAKQLDLMITLVREVFTAVATILQDFGERLTDLYTGRNSPLAILQRVIRTLKKMFQDLRTGFAELFKPLGALFESVEIKKPGEKPKKQTRLWVEIISALERAFATVLPALEKGTTQHWFLKRLKLFGPRFDTFGEIMGRYKKEPSKKKSDDSDGLLSINPPPPDLKFPEVPKFPAFPAWQISALGTAISVGLPPAHAPYGEVFQLDAAAQAALKKLERPPADYFAVERRKILGEKKAKDVLAAAQAEDKRLRAALFAVMDELMPPAVTAQIPKLQGLLWELDEKLYGTRAQFPVRDLPRGERLKPEVTKLRIRAPGMKDSEVRLWVKDLREALTKQPYSTAATLPTGT